MLKEVSIIHYLIYSIKFSPTGNVLCVVHCLNMTENYVFVIFSNYHIADTLAAISIALMTCGTMFPMSIYTGTILLQTTPGHVIGQLDKCLREVR